MDEPLRRVGGPSEVWIGTGHRVLAATIHTIGAEEDFSVAKINRDAQTPASRGNACVTAIAHALRSRGELDCGMDEETKDTIEGLSTLGAPITVALLAFWVWLPM
jgi:hypothetical protein